MIVAHWHPSSDGIAAASLVALTWAAVAPLHSASREHVFVIPKGTWARRMAGQKVEILPDHIHLTLGLRDILVLRNHDDVPQIFGPTLMMPGQSFTLPFDRPAAIPVRVHGARQRPDDHRRRIRTRVRPWRESPGAYARCCARFEAMQRLKDILPGRDRHCRVDGRLVVGGRWPPTA